jgi:hypothetical protein
LVHDTLKLVYDEAMNTVREKIQDILKLLGVTEQYNDKFLVRFRLLFQEYFSVIFVCTPENVDRVRTGLKRVISTYGGAEDIDSDIESKGFENLVSYSFGLCIFMVLHDPMLLFPINSFDKRTLMYHFFCKSDYVNIDGFAKEQSPCIVILPPPMLRSNNVYQGIKPAVYIIPNPSDAIKIECEKNSSSNKGRSHSTSDILNIQSAILTGDMSSSASVSKFQNTTEQSKKKNRENSNSESNLNSIVNTMTPVVVKQTANVFKESSNEVSPINTTPINPPKDPVVPKDGKNKIDNGSSHAPKARVDDEFNYKKYYDQPLSISKNIMKKSAIIDKPLSDIHNYKSNVKNYTVSHSRGSSIYESYSNEGVAGSNRTNDGFNHNFNKPMIPKVEDQRMLTGGFNEPDVNNSKSFHMIKKVKEPKTDDRSVMMEKDIDTDRDKRINYPFNKTSTGSKYTNINYKSPLITSILTKNEYSSSANRKKSIFDI